MRRPFLAMFADTPGATLIAQATVSGVASNTPVSVPPGAAAGDLMVVSVLYPTSANARMSTGSPGRTAAKWTNTGYVVAGPAAGSFGQITFARELAVGDLTATHTVLFTDVNTIVYVDVYRGVDGVCNYNWGTFSNAYFAFPGTDGRNRPGPTAAYGAIPTTFPRFGTMVGIREQALYYYDSPGITKPTLLTNVRENLNSGNRCDFVAADRLADFSPLLGQTLTWSGLSTAANGFLTRMVFVRKPCMRSSTVLVTGTPYGGNPTLDIISGAQGTLDPQEGDLYVCVSLNGIQQPSTQNNAALFTVVGALAPFWAGQFSPLLTTRVITLADQTTNSGIISTNNGGGFSYLSWCCFSLNGPTVATIKTADHDPATLVSTKTTTPFTPSASAKGHMLVLQVDEGSYTTLSTPSLSQAGWHLVGIISPSISGGGGDRFRGFVWIKIGADAADKYDGSAITINGLWANNNGGVKIGCLAITEFT